VFICWGVKVAHVREIQNGSTTLTPCTTRKRSGFAFLINDLVQKFDLGTRTLVALVWLAFEGTLPVIDNRWPARNGMLFVSTFK
jgi:hypothetical protein